MRLPRDEVVSRIAQLHSIRTPEGIDRQEKVRLGGVDQWIWIRGTHRDNPVLLFIHGGPGSPVMPMSWAFQRPWEDFFTVVQWDQRGVGKNWAHTDRDQLGATITFMQLVDDAEELCSYIREMLGKDRLVVLGWSYGTLIGVELVRRKPQWVSAYVGVSQVAIGCNSESYIMQRVLEAAKADGNEQALRDLRRLLPYPGDNLGRDLHKARELRKWVRAFNGGWYGVPDLSLLFFLQYLSPAYSVSEAESLEASTDWFLSQLAQNDGSGIADASLKDADRFESPIIFMVGRHDLQTPHTTARIYFDRLTAPTKRFVTFERASHFPMLEQPGLFLKALIDEVLPLTEGAVTLSNISM